SPASDLLAGEARWGWLFGCLVLRRKRCVSSIGGLDPHPRLSRRQNRAAGEGPAATLTPELATQALTELSRRQNYAGSASRRGAVIPPLSGASQPDGGGASWRTPTAVGVAVWCS